MVVISFQQSNTRVAYSSHEISVSLGRLIDMDQVGKYTSSRGVCNRCEEGIGHIQVVGANTAGYLYTSVDLEY